MFGIKSKVLNATLAATAAIPLATGVMFASAGSAQAAAFSGSFNYDPYAPRGSQVPTVEVLNGSLTFLPTSPADLDLTLQTGTFTTFDIAGVYNANSPYNSIFFDLGTFNTTSTSNDGKNVFIVQSLENPILSDTDGFGVTGRVNFRGYFTDDASNQTIQTLGAGHLNFSLDPTISLASAQQSLINNQVLRGTFTGAAFTTSVPEPATLLGLGAIGAVMAVSRRRKAQVSS